MITKLPTSCCKPWCFSNEKITRCDSLLVCVCVFSVQSQRYDGITQAHQGRLSLEPFINQHLVSVWEDTASLQEGTFCRSEYRIINLLRVLKHFEIRGWISAKRGDPNTKHPSLLQQTLPWSPDVSESHSSGITLLQLSLAGSGVQIPNISSVHSFSLISICEQCCLAF